MRKILGGGGRYSVEDEVSAQAAVGYEVVMVEVSLRGDLRERSGRLPSRRA